MKDKSFNPSASLSLSRNKESANFLAESSSNIALCTKGMAIIMKKLISLIFVLMLLLCACSHSVALAREEIAVFSFEQKLTTEADLNDTYSVKAADGYPATGGSAQQSSRFFASVSGVDYKKLEWSVYDELEDIDREYYSDETGSVAGLYGSVPLLDASAKNPWGVISVSPPYFEVVTTTKGYENLVLCASIGGSKKGPYKYALSYSLDGTEFVAIEKSLCTIDDNKVLINVYNEFALPRELDDKEKVYIRISVATDETIGGEYTLTLAPESGAAAINNVKVLGVPLASGDTQSATQNTAVLKRYEPQSHSFGILAPSILSFVH